MLLLLPAACAVQDYWPDEQQREFDLRLHYQAQPKRQRIRLPLSAADLTVLHMDLDAEGLTRHYFRDRLEVELPPGRALQLRSRIRLFRRPDPDGRWPAWPLPESFFPGAQTLEGREP